MNTETNKVRNSPGRPGFVAAARMLMSATATSR